MEPTSPLPTDNSPSLAYALQHTFGRIQHSSGSFLEYLAMYLKLIKDKVHRMTIDPPIDTRVETVGLDAAGLVALADIGTVQERTVLAGTSSFLDIFVLVPGLHLQQKAPSLNAGEHPACGALTTGYVFRVENPATVFYLQRVGRTGHLTHVEVEKVAKPTTWYGTLFSILLPGQEMSLVPITAYLLAVSWGIGVLILLALTGDWWGLTMCGSLMAARFINYVIIRERSHPGWAGADEGNTEGDLLILLSQDRWVRMKGLVNDLKAVTSGQWLRRERPIESWFTAIATVSVYLVAALAGNVEQFGKILLLCLFIGSAGLLAIANTCTQQLHMHGCVLNVVGEPKKYVRRRDLTDELIAESGRNDWAIGMGMITAPTQNNESFRGGAAVVT
ncbi:hypothetical protein TWF569_006738 [Orbilia oligospora]|uniref:Uncharacterized protein n=1 Tax=Orbilia oligospora TaxID=2813651 RepID=A0A7C8NDE4_ORBOL|nr:hypothetical protein TWF102_005222 [Orbilia oligospora]KAF3101801.1 hypothetical protein TWF103_007797 [Orbilia oligospora]KAF3111774.1 hypothetical protein TWF706_011503 [Orbilia oligospora]KAF3133585.1 hypothetical protein TWF703_006642 [Orbilia oligospora]KAF3140117.1 hypothetical protein TWF594_006504 [Orbilia oligospora]